MHPGAPKAEPGGKDTAGLVTTWGAGQVACPAWLPGHGLLPSAPTYLLWAWHPLAVCVCVCASRPPSIVGAGGGHCRIGLDARLQGRAIAANWYPTPPTAQLLQRGGPQRGGFHVHLLESHVGSLGAGLGRERVPTGLFSSGSSTCMQLEEPSPRHAHPLSRENTARNPSVRWGVCWVKPALPGHDHIVRSGPRAAVFMEGG